MAKRDGEDNLNQWIHVSDLKYWNSAVVPLYKLKLSL